MSAMKLFGPNYLTIWAVWKKSSGDKKEFKQQTLVEVQNKWNISSVEEK